ncbi:hypothetical protein KJ365_00215 [Glaciecola sp. XM2]|jgi:hypothetical protein|uniref:hypothetical protein n=1 Tax=Glaciecola sp. XM2 TaxID=1914931 RepID=UPI001BDDD053|nr:hypothetical protein [Glaciecola sp. XM2]MBT1449288.1 hypothetical protein [Glaciecola sp. XM2]
MKKQSFIAAVLLLLSIQANAVVISLDDQETDGAAFNILPFNNTDTREVLGISFSFFFEALSPSWASDLVVEIAHLDSNNFYQIGTQEFGCTDFGVECEFDLGWLDDSGVFEASGTLSLDPGTIADGSGEWEILIAESFDDDGVDGVFLDGSFVEVIQGERAIPASAPATALLFMFAGLSLVARKRLS